MMNYYESILKEIYEAIKEGDSAKALLLIKEELKQAYVPRDIENKLKALLSDIDEEPISYQKINDANINQYLKGSKEQQLLAVDYLNNKNLRDYLDLCNDYLSHEGFINAKVLLLDSLIRQEIGETIYFNNEGLEFAFIPKYVLPIEQSDGYLSATSFLNERYLKEPSKLKMANDLLYKELIMLLPLNVDEEEGILIAKKIVVFIEDAFA